MGCFLRSSKIASACSSNSSFSPNPSSKLVKSISLIKCDAPEDDPVIVSPFQMFL